MVINTVKVQAASAETIPNVAVIFMRMVTSVIDCLAFASANAVIFAPCTLYVVMCADAEI